MDCKSIGVAFEGSNPSLPIGAEVTQLVEYRPSKPRVAGSSPVLRFKGSEESDVCRSFTSNGGRGKEFVRNGERNKRSGEGSSNP